jgi:hypothetical protein
MLRRTVVAATVAVAMVVAAGRAFGAGFANPASNLAVTPSCASSANCLQGAVSYLDQARTRLGQPPYRLPGNFAQLTPPEQALVLTNLDRSLYGLTPVTGLTASLDQVAEAGVRSDTDPVLAGPTILAVTSNWGGGFPNMPYSYGAWMYDDGPGGENLDCVTARAAGCWVHRHNVLWRFTGSGALAMGAAAGTDRRGAPGFAMVLVQGTSNFRPSYVYTWSQAVAAGAGAPAGATQARRLSVGPTRRQVGISRLRVRGRTISFRVIAPAATRPACSLVRTSSAVDHYLRCGSAVTYRRVRLGDYRLSIRAAGTTVTRRLRVR